MSFLCLAALLPALLCTSMLSSLCVCFLSVVQDYLYYHYCIIIIEHFAFVVSFQHCVYNCSYCEIYNLLLALWYFFLMPAMVEKNFVLNEIHYIVLHSSLMLMDASLLLGLNRGSHATKSQNAEKTVFPIHKVGLPAPVTNTVAWKAVIVHHRFLEILLLGRLSFQSGLDQVGYLLCPLRVCCVCMMLFTVIMHVFVCNFYGCFYVIFLWLFCVLFLWLFYDCFLCTISLVFMYYFPFF